LGVSSHHHRQKGAGSGEKVVGWKEVGCPPEGDSPILGDDWGLQPGVCLGDQNPSGGVGLQSFRDHS